MGKTTNNNQAIERLEWFEKELFQLLTPVRVIERKAAQKWGIGSRMTKKYIQKVRARWAKTRVENVEQIRDELSSACKTVYANALDSGDGRTAVAALRELRALHGAGEAERIKLEASHAVLGLSTVADLRELQGDIRNFLAQDPSNIKRLMGESIDVIEVVHTGDGPKNGTNGANGSNGSNGHGH